MGKRWERSQCAPPKAHGGGSPPLFCLYIRGLSLAWPTDEGGISPVLQRGFRCTEPITESPPLPSLSLSLERSFPGVGGAGGGAVGWGEREERRVHSFTPQMLSPPPLPIFLGKLSCSNLAHAIKLTEQCLFEVFWDCEMFKGTLAERGPEVGSPKFPSPSHPLILGIRKSSLPK